MRGKDTIVEVALNGAPTGRDSWVEQRFDSVRRAADERAKVVTYLHAMADEAVRRGETEPWPAPHERQNLETEASVLRDYAEAIENGEHWQ